MKSLISCLAIAAIVLTSCKKELEPQESSETSETVAADVVESQSDTQTGNFLEPKPATAATTGVNPAHGEPGHRCDIAVGAPLNPNAAAVQSATPVQSTPQIITTTTAAPAKVASGINPAHGQPGHRCDIAVGASLSSAPAKTSAQPVPATTTINSDVTVNAASNVKVTTTDNNATPALLKAPAAATAAGMNPAHGQEGHRCDIAVGAALPKA